VDTHSRQTLCSAVDRAGRLARTLFAGAILVVVASGFPGFRSAYALDAEDELTCEPGAILAGGRPDPTIFADDASRGVRASWCERYDRYGVATRTGPYREVYPGGAIRTEARYVDSHLRGPVTIRNEDGGLFLKGFLVDGEWVGELEIFHPNGAVWLETHFDHGVLEGAVRSHYADGALESETRFQHGREDGLARSFYPSTVGGRLKSEAYVEADRIVGQHRLLDREGEVVRTIDWETGPLAWRSALRVPAPGPAAPDISPYRQPESAPAAASTAAPAKGDPVRD
jgi:hypothetical protein